MIFTWLWQPVDCQSHDVTPVFRAQRQARACVKLQAKEATVTRSNADENPSSFTPEGQELLDQAREVDMMVAIFRNRVINPDHYHDDEQAQVHTRAETIPTRTKRRWQMRYREAEHLRKRLDWLASSSGKERNSVTFGDAC